LTVLDGTQVGVLEMTLACSWDQALDTHTKAMPIRNRKNIRIDYLAVLLT